MQNSSFQRIVTALADSFEFNDAVRLTLKKDPQSAVLKGKKEMIAGQFKTLRDRVNDATKNHRSELLELPYEEARREVDRRQRERKLTIDRKKARDLENRLLWG